jgi:hypothetical protein
VRHGCRRASPRRGRPAQGNVCPLGPLSVAAPRRGTRARAGAARRGRPAQGNTGLRRRVLGPEQPRPRSRTHAGAWPPRRAPMSPMPTPPAPSGRRREMGRSGWRETVLPGGATRRGLCCSGWEEGGCPREGRMSFSGGGGYGWEESRRRLQERTAERRNPNLT